MPIMYYCSNGERISDATIKSRLSKAYRDKYQDGHPACMGCGKRAEGSAHPIPKARLKVLHLTDKIYHPDFFIPSCTRCNLIMENPSTESFKQLMCYEYCKELIRKHDPERYAKIN